jgi:hypothetical protein
MVVLQVLILMAATIAVFLTVVSLLVTGRNYLNAAVAIWAIIAWLATASLGILYGLIRFAIWLFT